VFKTQDECFILGDLVYDPPTVTAQDARQVDTMREFNVNNTDNGFTTDTLVYDDPTYCDVACTPFPCEVTTGATQNCTRETDCELSLDTLYTNTGLGNQGAHGDIQRITLEDEITAILRVYYDNDVAVVLAMHTETRFRDQAITSVSGATPTFGGPVSQVHEVSSQTKWTSACVATGGIPDKVVEERTPVTRDKTTDFNRLSDWETISTLTTCVEFLIDGAVDETLDLVYTRTMQAVKNSVGASFGPQNIDSEIAFIPQTCANTISLASAECALPADVALIIVDEAPASNGLSTDTYTRTVDHEFTVNGVLQMAYQEVNASFPDTVYEITDDEYRPQFDGPTLGFFKENPEDVDWFDAYQIDRVVVNNRVIAVDVNIDIDVDGTAPGQFSTVSRYNLFSGLDKVVGETDLFGNVDPDTGLINESTASECYV
jgi:hypothetical protein